MCLQLVPAVTELVISELLWLNYSNPEKPVYVYLHSIGSQTPDGQAVGFDTEAYAILDTLAYIRPVIHTLVVGQVCLRLHCLEAQPSVPVRFTAFSSCVAKAAWLSKFHLSGQCCPTLLHCCKDYIDSTQFPGSMTRDAMSLLNVSVPRCLD